MLQLHYFFRRNTSYEKKCVSRNHSYRLLNKKMLLFTDLSFEVQREVLLNKATSFLLPRLRIPDIEIWSVVFIVAANVLLFEISDVLESGMVSDFRRSEIWNDFRLQKLESVSFIHCVPTNGALISEFRFQTS